MRHEASLVQLPSEIIHNSLEQPSPLVPAALSGTSIKAKVLNALAIVLKGRSTASCGRVALHHRGQRSQGIRYQGFAI
jgi:hypothetical protein